VWSATPNRFFAEEVTGMTPGRALDLGAGEGRNAIWLAEQGWTVTAVDFSDVAVAKAETIASRRGVTVIWLVEDLLAYQPESGAYDLVALAYIHLPPAEWNRVLSSAQSALAPGGTLLVIGHDSSNLRDGHGGPQDPMRLYDAAGVVSQLAGLDVQRAGPVLRKVMTPDGERTAIDVLVRAVRPTPA